MKFCLWSLTPTLSPFNTFQRIRGFSLLLVTSKSDQDYFRVLFFPFLQRAHYVTMLGLSLYPLIPGNFEGSQVCEDDFWHGDLRRCGTSGTSCYPQPRDLINTSSGTLTLSRALIHRHVSARCLPLIRVDLSLKDGLSACSSSATCLQRCFCIVFLDTM